MDQIIEDLKVMQAIDIFHQRGKFLEESNRIEGITREVHTTERKAFDKFLALEKITIQDLSSLVTNFQKGAKLRDKPGMDVRVGTYYPPKGGSSIHIELQELLAIANHYMGDAESAYKVHHIYEKLHPFTDGNGRSGRMLWWKMMGGSKIGFLHKWYYQTLEYGR